MSKRDNLHLETTGDDMTELWDSINATRINTPTVKAHKATLTRLLIDHQKLLNFYEKHS